MKHILAIFFSIFSLTVFSQLDSCGYVDTYTIVDQLNDDDANLEIRSFNEATKFILDLKEARQAGRNVSVTQYYVPIIINFITPDNAPLDEMFQFEEDISVMTNTVEWCESFLDGLNEIYSISKWRSGTGLNEDVYSNPDIDVGITFIPGNIDTLGQDQEWVRYFNFDDFTDEMLPFYERGPNYSSYLDLDKPMPYYAESIEYTGVNGFSMAAVYNNATIVETFGYAPYRYLNIFVMGPIALQPEYNVNNALYSGWASSPLSVNNTPKSIEDNIWSGNAVYINDKTWRKNTSTPAHEVGHFFGLAHTSNGTSDCEEALSDWESGDCYGRGDYLCDTPPMPQDSDPCYSTDVNSHCLIYDVIPHDPSNIMDHTFGCDLEHFTQGQADKMIATIKSTTRNRFMTTDHGNFIVGHDGGCLADPNACNYSPNGSLDIECLYVDALDVCGGDCESDVDGDKICDDIDPCIDAECDPCKGITEIEGIRALGPTPVIAIGNRCWTTADFETGPHVSNAIQTHFKDRDETFTSNEPAVTIASSREPGEAGYFHNYAGYDGVLFNWYFINEYDVCPTGWHVSTDEDWMDLEKALGVPETDLKRFTLNQTEDIATAIRTSDMFYDAEFNDNRFIGYVDSFSNIQQHTAMGYYWTTDEFRTPWPSRRENAIYRRVTASDYYTKPSNSGIYRTVTNDDVGITRAYSTNKTSLGKTNGMSVRCVKDLD